MSHDVISLAGAKLDQHRHVCAFFHSQDEEYEVLLPFIKVVDPNLREDHIRRLKSVGIDTGDLESKNQLEIREWEKAYLRSNGGFNQYDMLQLIEEVLISGPRDGFPLTRLVAHMEWSCTGRAGVNDIVEYESRLNLVLPKYHDPVICTYDLAKFSAGTAIDIMRTHPMVIVGGILQENPFYVPPEVFLKELEARRSSPALR
jgi:hypothetical protein